MPSRFTEEPAEAGHWTLDRRVPLALILALLGQCIVAVWWARGFVSAQESHERRLVALESSKERERVGERLATIEAEMRNVATVVQRIDERTQRGAHKGDR